MKDEHNFKKIDTFFKHPLWDTFATWIKKFKSSKSYWSVSFLVILFTLREVIAWKYGSAIEAYAQKQLDGSDFAWLWTVVSFVFDIGGSWELVLLGVLYFIILSYVKVNSAEKDEMVKVVKEESSKTHQGIDEIKELIKLHGISETEFLEKYFGKDYVVILENPQTYHNFTTKLKQINISADELLKEREELLNKIASQSFDPKLQKQIDKAFRELRYEDARELIDGFLEANNKKEKEIIKAHYLKALSYMEQIRYHEAKDEFEKIALNIDDVQILSDYARMYNTLGEYRKAIKCNEKVLIILFATLGEVHPDIATCYNNIGFSLQLDGKENVAMEYYQKALDVQLISLGEFHAYTATSYNNISSIFFYYKEYDKAIEYYEKSLKITVRTMGENHTDTAITLNNIGLVCNAKKEYSKAIDYYSKSLEIQLSISGDRHPIIITIYNNIGSSWQSNGNIVQAMHFYEKALEIQLDLLGNNHPNAAITYSNIGSVWESEKKYDKAIEYYEKSLEIFRRIFSNGHTNINIVENNLKRVKESLFNAN